MFNSSVSPYGVTGHNKLLCLPQLVNILPIAFCISKIMLVGFIGCPKFWFQRPSEILPSCASSAVFTGDSQLAKIWPLGGPFIYIISPWLKQIIISMMFCWDVIIYPRHNVNCDLAKSLSSIICISHDITNWGQDNMTVICWHFQIDFFPCGAVNKLSVLIQIMARPQTQATSHYWTNDCLIFWHIYMRHTASMR